MNGRDLTLGLVAGLALAGAVRSRGSRAMLRPETLPSDVRVQVHIDRSGLHTFVEIGALRGEDVVGIFRMERGFRPGHPNLFEVSETEARLDGLGPLLYDLGLEISHRLHAKGVVPDQSEISTEAARVWKHYHEQRPDVTSTPLPRGFLDEEEEEERRFATDPRQGHVYTSGPYRESLARVYSKTSTSVMDGLVRRGMLEMEPARGSAARTAPPKHVPVERFWTISSKLEETLQDVAEGRRSYSYDAPLRVSALDTPRGHYFVLDGHHRLVERLQAGDRTVAVELDPYTPRIERTGGAHRNMVAQKVNVAARVRRGSAARTESTYPGPLVPHTGSPAELAEAYLALRAAVPSLPVLRALYALAEADLDGAPPPTEGQISNDLYFPSPEGMAKKLREGQFPATRALLGRMPRVWPAAVALSARLHAKSASDARKEGKKATADARWEAQAMGVDPDAMPSARALRGQDVWLYHGTTSAFLPRILREGLVPGKDARPPRKRLLGLRANLADRGGQIRFQPHVFLTADDSGRAASAGWYARQAAHVHGGDPVVLRVIVPYDALAPDPDDADIRSGRYQFVIDHVPPEAIREVDGARRGKTR